MQAASGGPYTGHVEAEGPRIERLDGPLSVRKFSVGDLDNNVYAIACARTGTALIVDAADHAARILDQVADLHPVAVVQTHGHWDHVRAWDGLRAAGLEVWGHRGDEALFPHRADRWLEDGDRLEVGDLTVEVLHTPGHTDGSLCYLVEGDQRPHLFTGDTLFPGGVGRTTSPAAFRRLFHEVTTKLFDRLGDDTWVYPGHGDDTTLGAERGDLDAWRERGW